MHIALLELVTVTRWQHSALKRLNGNVTSIKKNNTKAQCHSSVHSFIMHTLCIQKNSKAYLCLHNRRLGCGCLRRQLLQCAGVDTNVADPL